MKPSSDEKEGISSLIFAELKALGVKIPKIKKPKVPTLKSVPSNSENKHKIFGISLCEQEWITENDYTLPKFLLMSINYLAQFIKHEIGLFRKAGSVARQRKLRVKLENGGTLEGSEPNDVASLLKQWLRELPESLIPSYLSDLFLRCQQLNSEDSCLSAVLLSCLLLPCEHLHTVKHFFNFLSEIAANSEINKMVPHNLVVIMAPNIFPINGDRTDCKSKNNLVQYHTSLVELLICNAKKIGQIPPGTSEKLSLNLNKLKSAAEISNLGKLKKKRKNTGVIDIVCEIRKFVGGNLESCQGESVEMMELQSAQNINFEIESKQPSKRKADLDICKSLELIKRKPECGLNSELKETSLLTPIGKRKGHTPGTRNRGRSFGLLKKKHKKENSATKTLEGLKCNNPTASVMYNSQKNEIDADTKINVLSNAVPIKNDNNVPDLVEITPVVARTTPYLKVNNVDIKRTFSDSCNRSSNKSIIISHKTKSASHSDLRSRRVSPRLKSNLPIKSRSPRKCNSHDVHHLQTHRLNRKRPVITKSNSSLASGNNVNTVANDCQNKLLNFEQVKIVLTNQNDSTPSNLTSKDSIEKDSIIISKRDSSQFNEDKENTCFNEPLDKLLKTDFSAETLIKNEKCNNLEKLKTGDLKSSSAHKRANKHSIRRGRPNTIKTGLPELCPKYSTDMVSNLKSETKRFKSASDFQLNLQISFESDKSDQSSIFNDVPKKLNLDINDCFETRNDSPISDISFNTWLNLTPAEFKSNASICFTTKSLNKNEKSDFDCSLICNKTSEFEKTSEKKNNSSKRASLRKSFRLSSGSYSFENSFQGNKSKQNTPKITVTSTKASSENESLKELEFDKENNENWMNSEKFVANHLLSPENIASCKRDSIVQLIKNNAGKVQQIVQHHNYIANKSTPQKPDPTSLCFKTPNVRKTRSKSLKDNKNETYVSSLKMHSNANSELKSTSTNIGLKKPFTFQSPKIYDSFSPMIASPLKEVTNLNISRKDSNNKI